VSELIVDNMWKSFFTPLAMGVCLAKSTLSNC